MNNIEFKTIIDTIAIDNNINNFEDFTTVNKENYEYITELKDDFKKCSKRVRLSLDKKYGELTLDTYSKHNIALEESLNNLGVINIDEVELNRIDIALDTNSYILQADFKKLLFFFELLTINQKKSSKWYTTNLNTLKQNTIKLMDSHYELEIYDKALESNNVHPYKTRVEFRYKKVNRNTSKHFKDDKTYFTNTINKIKLMDKNIKHLEANMTNRLLKLYDEEKNTVKSFSEFVRKYNHFFYTSNILKEVYKQANLKGNYSNWIKDFRKRNTIEFYTTTDVKQAQKAMLKSIRDYN